MGLEEKIPRSRSFFVDEFLSVSFVGKVESMNSDKRNKKALKEILNLPN